MMSQASMSLEYWDHAVTSAVYLINCLPSSSIHQEVPYQRLFKKLPDYKFLKVFGCACYPLLRPYNQHKLEPQSQECLFLGYSLSHKGYKCMAADGRIYISKDVIFDELSFPFPRLFGDAASGSAATASTSSQHTLTVLSVPPTATTSATTASDTSASQAAALVQQSPVTSTSVSVDPVSDFPDSQQHQEPLPTDVAYSQATALVRPENIHPMCTGAKAGVDKPR